MKQTYARSLILRATIVLVVTDVLRRGYGMDTCATARISSEMAHLPRQDSL